MSEPTPKCERHTRDMVREVEVGGFVCKHCGYFLFPDEVEDDGGEL